MSKQAKSACKASETNPDFAGDSLGTLGEKTTDTHHTSTIPGGLE